MRPNRLVAAVLAGVLIGSACSTGVEPGVQGGTHDGTVTSTTTVAAGSAPGDDDPATRRPAPSGTGSPADAGGAEPGVLPPEVRAALAAQVPAGAGVALAPVGGGDVSVLGGWSSGVAWSTIKVPLAVAAVRADPAAAGAVEPALTVSDNAAAESLWATLGGGAGAAGAVGAVLAEAGDPATVVPSQRLREGFSVFGQSEWTLADQARFGAGLPCLPDAGTVLEPMSRVTGAQQWGLGAIGGAVFKGGWGPAVDGTGYLVRQFGVVPTPHGRTAVALAVEGQSYPDGSATLSQLATALAGVRDRLPAGEC